MNGLNLRWALMVLCLVVFVVSFAWLLLAAWRHHRTGSLDRVNFHRSLAVEIAWTVVPCVIVLLLVWPAVRHFWAP